MDFIISFRNRDKKDAFSLDIAAILWRKSIFLFLQILFITFSETHLKLHMSNFIIFLLDVCEI